MKRNAVPLFLGILLATGLFANSRSSKTAGYNLTIKVVKSETGSLTVDNPHVGACDQANYSAYCKHAAAEFPQSRMVVEGGDEVFNITCTAENQWSNCVSLPVGDTFKARVEKQGLSVLYQGSDGKAHKQLYAVLYAGSALKPLATAGGADSAAATPAATTNSNNLKSASALRRRKATPLSQQLLKCLTWPQQLHHQEKRCGISFRSRQGRRSPWMVLTWEMHPPLLTCPLAPIRSKFPYQDSLCGPGRL